MGFCATAQDLPSIEFTFFNGNDYALAVGDDISARCVEVKSSEGSNSAITSVGSVFVYTVDADGQMYRNNIALGNPNPAFVSIFNSGSFNRLYTRQEDGTYSGANID